MNVVSEQAQAQVFFQDTKKNFFCWWNVEIESLQRLRNMHKVWRIDDLTRWLLHWSSMLRVNQRFCMRNFRLEGMKRNSMIWRSILNPMEPRQSSYYKGWYILDWHDMWRTAFEAVSLEEPYDLPNRTNSAHVVAKPKATGISIVHAEVIKDLMRSWFVELSYRYYEKRYIAASKSISPSLMNTHFRAFCSRLQSTSECYDVLSESPIM